MLPARKVPVNWDCALLNASGTAQEAGGPTLCALKLQLPSVAAPCAANQPTATPAGVLQPEGFAQLTGNASGSSSAIFTVATLPLVVITAPVAPDNATVNVFSPSATESWRIGTEIFLSAPSPSAQLR